MKIPYDTPAQKYTGALLGSFTGQLPPASAPYTRLLKSIIDNTEMPMPDNELLKNIYKFFGGDIDVAPPVSRLSQLLQYGIFSDRYSVTDKTDDSITVFDNLSSQSFTMILDDFLEFLWAEIITKNTPPPAALNQLITADGKGFITADNKIFCVGKKVE